MFSQKAFTLVELMIVIAIIGILAAALFPSYSRYQAGARDVQRTNDLRKIATALELFYTEKGSLPQNYTDLSTTNDCLPGTTTCADAGCWGSWDAGNTRNIDPNDTFIEPLKTYNYMTTVPRERFSFDITAGSDVAWGRCTYRYQFIDYPGLRFAMLAIRMERKPPNTTNEQPSYMLPLGWGEGATGSTESVYFIKQN